MMHTASYTLILLAVMAVILFGLYSIHQWIDRIIDLIWMAVLRHWVIYLIGTTAAVILFFVLLGTRKLALSFWVALVVTPFLARPLANWLAERRSPDRAELPKGGAIFARRKRELAAEFEAATLDEAAH